MRGCVCVRVIEWKAKEKSTKQKGKRNTNRFEKRNSILLKMLHPALIDSPAASVVDSDGWMDWPPGVCA